MDFLHTKPIICHVDGFKVLKVFKHFVPVHLIGRWKYNYCKNIRVIDIKNKFDLGIYLSVK